ncbi:MAG TPA: hypothetical protein VHT30_13465 [Acidimicrobiales bacterium]|jgi:hypothetical protein|nr:hypothetical protein [Acidimicrobiales bacterium]
MARHNHTERVRTDGLADLLRERSVAELFSDAAVGCRLTEGYCRHVTPDRALGAVAVRSLGKVEIAPGAGEIVEHLLGRDIE